ncbi:MAG: hypothetical protein L6Q84_06135 [Polyangiaceae bacterium]|nr:hypothetical protein [Polyangiaceae bacterium]
MTVRDTVEGLLDDARDWSESRSPWARLPLLLYLVYAGVRHLLDPMYRSWFAGLTLVLHELGHLFFSAFGQTLMLLGGSLTQLAAPALVAAYLLFFQRDWFGLSVGVSWLSFSTFELATYVDDANKNQLALVGMGDKVLHDWDTLLTQWHLLNHCGTFAFALRALATLGLVAAFGLGGWLVYRMLRSDRLAVD